MHHGNRPDGVNNFHVITEELVTDSIGDESVTTAAAVIGANDDLAEAEEFPFKDEAFA